MDLTLLALAKGYTDKRIEKAEMGNIELDQSLSKSGQAADAKAVGDKFKNLQIPIVDNTLTQEGAAADAKAVGEALRNVNTSEQTQANWEQNDETAADFIKNRTHYKTQIDFTIIENKTVEFDVTFVGETSWTGTADIQINKQLPAPIAENNIITAIINGVEWTAPVKYNSGKGILHAEIYDEGGGGTDILFDQYDIEYPILRRISITHQGETPFDYNNFTLSLYVSGASVMQIPLEYIPVDQSLNHPISEHRAVDMVNAIVGQIPRSYYDLNDIPCYAKESESVFLDEVYFADNDRLSTVESNWHMSWYTMFKIKGQLYPRKQYYVDQYGYICYYYCGNGALIDNTGVAELEDTGENFVIYANAESNVFTAYYNGEIDGEYGFVIYGVTPEEVKELDERCIPDTIARVSEIPELSKKVFYIDFTDNDDGTYQANKNVVEVQTAYVSGADVKARITYNGMPLIVPMCIIEENLVIYGGAIDAMTMYILHQDTQASVSAKELALKSSVDELSEQVQSVDDNIGTCIPMVMTGNVGQIPVATSVLNGVPNGWEMIDLPSGGGSVSALDWEYINTLSFVKDDGVASLYCSETADGNPFEYDEILIMNGQSDYGSSAKIWCNRETQYLADCATINSFLSFGQKKYCLLKTLLVNDDTQWILAESTNNNPVLYNIVSDSGAMRKDGKITSVCVAKSDATGNAQAILKFYGRNYK